MPLHILAPTHAVAANHRTVITGCLINEADNWICSSIAQGLLLARFLRFLRGRLLLLWIEGSGRYAANTLIGFSQFLLLEAYDVFGLMLLVVW